MTVWERISSAAADLTKPSSILGLLRDWRGLLGGGGEQSAPENQVAFTIGLIALSAKMAKADGVVTKDEVDAFNDILKVPPEDAANVRRVFDLAKKDVAGYEAYAQQLADLLKNDKPLLQNVLEGLFHIASADHAMHPAEDAYLAEVARRFGFTETEFRHIRARFVPNDERSPYDVLRVDPSISNADLKAQYRRLVAANHPDKLAGRGLPPEFIEVATRKIAAINAAYEEIARERGL